MSEWTKFFWFVFAVEYAILLVWALLSFDVIKGFFEGIFIFLANKLSDAIDAIAEKAIKTRKKKERM